MSIRHLCSKATRLWRAVRGGAVRACVGLWVRQYAVQSWPGPVGAVPSGVGTHASNLDSLTRPPRPHPRHCARNRVLAPPAHLTLFGPSAAPPSPSSPRHNPPCPHPTPHLPHALTLPPHTHTHTHPPTHTHTNTHTYIHTHSRIHCLCATFSLCSLTHTHVWAGFRFVL